MSSSVHEGQYSTIVLLNYILATAHHIYAALDKDTYLFEGDIILTKRQKLALFPSGIKTSGSKLSRSKRSYDSMQSGNVVKTWPRSIIPYIISTKLNSTYQKMLRNAMNSIESETCIRFVPRTMEKNYVLIEKNNKKGCTSYLGYANQLQKVTIGDSCATAGSLLHELGHTVGLYHEHTRPDRDNYITVHYENLRQAEDKKNFVKIPTGLFKSVPDVGYDLESVMHYGPYAFAREANGHAMRTVVIRGDTKMQGCSYNLPMGQRRMLSYKDKKRINLLYKCENVNISHPICRNRKPSSISSPGNKKATLIRVPEIHDQLTTRCIPVPCVGSSCKGIQTLFQIYKLSKGETHVESGDTVAFRSVSQQSHFMKCTKAMCNMSRCDRDYQQQLDLNDLDYTSSCREHQFEIFNMKRRNSMMTHSMVYLKKKFTNLYLSCNGDTCHLQHKGICLPTNFNRAIFYPMRKKSGHCQIDAFKIDRMFNYLQ